MVPVPLDKVVVFFNSILKTSGNSKDMSYAFGGQSDGSWNMKEERENKTMSTIFEKVELGARDLFC
jgi:hypothetical protein